MVSKSKEDQAKRHVLSDFLSVGVDEFSQQLNKLHFLKRFYSGHKSKSDVLVVVFVVWVLVLGWLGCFT